MLNLVWIIIMLVSIVYAFSSGRAAQACQGMFAGAEDSISFLVKIGSFMVLWQGMLNIAEESQLTRLFSKILSPLICKIFSRVKKGSKEAALIANNLTANILGLSNAATPLGISAMKELGKSASGKTATADMCLLAVINSSSLQLIPSTLIAMRTSFGSKAPGEIIVPIWIVSAATVVFAVLICKINQRRKGI